MLCFLAPSSPVVDHALRLLHDLLEHKMLVVALHNLLQLHLERVDFAFGGFVAGRVVLFATVDGQHAIVDCGHVVVLQI